MLRRQHADRPLIGDSLHPNVALVLAQPLRLDSARDWLTAVPFTGEVDPPRGEGAARALLLAVDDLDAARAAFAGWRVEQPDSARIVPPQVAAAAARVPRDALTLVLVAASIAVFTVDHRVVGFLIWMPLAFLLVQRMNRRKQRQAAQAREEIDRRGQHMSAADRATALAAVDANLGPAPSQGPPGFGPSPSAGSG